jgi:hypothetical protein
VFQRFHKPALDSWLLDEESFDKDEQPDCESIELGVEHVAVANLVARARNPQTNAPRHDPLYEVIVGTAGTSVHEDGDYPRIMTERDVATASIALDEITPEQLHRVFDRNTLKDECWEIEEWLWDHFGPRVLEKHLLPMLASISGFFRRAAERKQQVVVDWF